MNENDKTEILEPVETPAENITEPSKDGRKCPKWLLPLVAAVCAVILVVAGIIGWNAYSGAKLAEAKEACATAADTVRNNANEYNALLNGDAADAAAVKAEQVKDSKTVESLGKELKAMAPEYEGCVADGKDGLETAIDELDDAAAWYEKHAGSLKKAVDAVNDSKLAKTIDTAKTLLESSNGNVQDDKTREELSKAIEAKDEAAIAKASKAVNDSIAAKQKADEEAKPRPMRKPPPLRTPRRNNSSTTISSLSPSNPGHPHTPTAEAPLVAEAAPREVPQAAPPVPPTAGASATAAAITLEVLGRAELARRKRAASDLLTCRHETRPIRSGEFFYHSLRYLPKYRNR